MTALDALTNDAGARVRKGRSRELGGPLVLHLFRLLKLAQMHSLENQAVRTQLDEAAAAFLDYRLKSGEAAAFFFARGVVFFGGEPLKAPRSAYESALELGAMMKRCGGSELTFSPDIGAEELRIFVVAVTRTLRESMTKFADFDVPKVRLREVSAAAQLRGLEVERLDEEQRIVRTYASAVVVMRRFFEELLRGEAEMPRRIKRVAQALVDLSAGRTPTFLGVTAVRNANHDDAGRAVNTAILAVAMARRLTGDRATLTRIAMAALLLDSGRPRALRALRGDDDDPSALPTTLPDSSERGLPAGAAVVLASLGRINEPTVVRSVVAYEALWSRRTMLLGSLYRGLRPPTLHARVVAVARAYNDLLTPRPAEPPRSPAEALLRLEEELGASKDRADQTVLRLLMATVGQLPPGTLVELTSGASAVVVFGDSSRLRLRILLEADGALPDGVRELAVGEENTEIARIVGSDPTFAQQRAAPPASLRRPPSPSMPAPPPSMPAPAPASPAAPSSTPTPAARRDPPTRQSPAPAVVAPEPPSMRRPVASTPPEPPRHAEPPPSRRAEPPPSMRSAPTSPVSVRPPAEVSDDDRTVAMVRPSFFPRMSTPSVPPAAPSVPPAAPSTPPPSTPGGPSFSGDLQRSPPPHLLLNILSRGLTGTLVLTSPEQQEHKIVFEAGVPKKIQSQAPARRLGEILVGRELASEQQVEAAVSKATARRIQLGKQLVIEGTLSSREVMEALSIQMVERLGGLCALPRASRYGFFSEQDLLPQEVALAADPLAAVFTSICAWDNQERMEDTLARLGARPIQLHAHATLDRFGFSPEERAMIDWIIEQRLSFPEVKVACADTLEGVRTLVYTLAIARHLDLGPSQWPLGVPRLTEESTVASLASMSGVSSVSAITLGTPAPGSLSPPSVSKIVPASAVGASPALAGTPVPSAVSAVPSSGIGASVPSSAVGAAVPSSQRGAAVPSSQRGSAATPSSSQRLAASEPSSQQGPESRPSRPPTSVRLQSGPAISEMPPAATESLIVRTATPEPIAEDRLSQPPSLRDPLDERRQVIQARAEAIAGKNHYEVLGVEQDAPVAEIQKAFLAAVKVFHPDRLPEPLADLRDVASRVFSAVVEAHKTLTDAPARSAYDATLATDGTAADAAEQAEIERVLRASSSFQKAEILLRRNDVDGAEALAREAVDLDPQPDHLALLGWVHALRNRLPEALDHLNRSIDASPQAEAALFYRGTVLKRMGHQSKALSDFRRVAELNPKNLDAVREVRLHERRGQEAEEAKSGLLGKLFSKKK